MRLLLCVLMFATCTACASGGSSVELGGKSFSVEIADTREKQALGLMFRDEMPADEGMLFKSGLAVGYTVATVVLANVFFA